MLGFYEASMIARVGALHFPPYYLYCSAGYKLKELIATMIIGTYAKSFIILS
jgi:hypothetical protein